MEHFVFNLKEYVRVVGHTHFCAYTHKYHIIAQNYTNMPESSGTQRKIPHLVGIHSASLFMLYPERNFIYGHYLCRRITMNMMTFQSGKILKAEE